jgi:hypothetical protein
MKRNHSFFIAVSSVALFIGGLLWVVGRYLVMYVPSPFTYDDYNRMFVIPLLLLIVGFLGAYELWSFYLSRLGRMLFLIGIVGLALSLFGTMIEFWVVLLQSKRNAYDAYLNGGEVWIGSHIGWGLFLTGMLLLVISFIGVGIYSWRCRISILFRICLPFAGLFAVLSVFQIYFSYVFGLICVLSSIQMWLYSHHAGRMPGGRNWTQGVELR